MSRARRFVILAIALAVLAVGCMTSASVDSGDVAPTPLPTKAPVFIPTTAPPPPTPAADLDDDENTATASDDEGSEAAEPDAAETPEPTATAGPTPTPTVAPTPTADVIPVPTARPAPTRAPIPRAAPTPLPISSCASGQVLVNGNCACPAGQTNRASDGQCVRFCSQAELTISNTCVCAGDLYDNGGQCVRQCRGNEVPDDFGGCKIPTADD